MKKLLTAVILSAPLISVAIAQGNKVDLSALKCRELFEMRHEQIKIVMAWLQGYYTDEDELHLVDLDRLSGEETKLSAYCATNPQKDVSSAAKALFGN